MGRKEVVRQRHATLALALASAVVALGLGPFRSAAAASLGAHNSFSRALLLGAIRREEASLTLALPSLRVAHAVDALDVALVLRAILPQPPGLA